MSGWSGPTAFLEDIQGAAVERLGLRVAALGVIEPGKPGQNAHVERFNRSYREQVRGS